jgi:hypothetical protein
MLDVCEQGVGMVTTGEYCNGNVLFAFWEIYVLIETFSFS